MGRSWQPVLKCMMVVIIYSFTPLFYLDNVICAVTAAGALSSMKSTAMHLGFCTRAILSVFSVETKLLLNYRLLQVSLVVPSLLFIFHPSCTYYIKNCICMYCTICTYLPTYLSKDRSSTKPLLALYITTSNHSKTKTLLFFRFFPSPTGIRSCWVRLYMPINHTLLEKSVGFE